jgi:steroid 5-alpha reductase family enzyme
MTFLEVYLIGLGVVLGLMAVLWVASLVLRDSSIVDPFWGTGFVVVNWLYFALTPDGFPGRKWLICLLVTVWGLRLSIHLLRRNWGRGEDFRYRKWREEADSRWWWRSFFRVFMLQGVLLWMMSAPLLAAQMRPTPDRLTALDWLGGVVWAIGFFFEAMGDLQLTRFRNNPANRGKVLNTGVWRYTRHPNYFGDATQWWGYYLIAAAGGGFWTIWSPVLMTLMLLRVSGVALLEKTLTTTKPGYREYVESTSAFVPWFPRKARQKKP